jgi:beta-glucanase (GH16 family)
MPATDVSSLTRDPVARPRLWIDDFDGPAGTSPSSRHWRAELGGGGWGDEQLQRYTDDPANAALDGQGRLAINARRSATGTITSARLTTKRLITARYGRVDARIKVPAGRGTWPAFWLLGTDIDAVGWPRCGEIDVMEFVGSEPRTVHGTLHGPGYAGVGNGIGAAYDTGFDLAGDFHVYAVDWTPDRITWSIDGAAYCTLGRSDVPGGAWVFEHDFYLLVNLAIGGSWPGNTTDDPSLPATMLIDWVRVNSPHLRAGDAAQHERSRPA